MGTEENHEGNSKMTRYDTTPESREYTCSIEVNTRAYIKKYMIIIISIWYISKAALGQAAKANIAQKPHFSRYVTYSVA